ncbi:MAG TPA: WD40 repeat domain-containing protein [Thermoanaerobaculia bacterium]|nr:WD40 repeat domain-containing protein [Thermoanaerobaculia bacterium]
MTLKTIGLLLASILAASSLDATQVHIFQIQNQAGFLAGTLEGVSVDSLGRMSLAPRAERLASIGEPFLLSAAAGGDGWVVGTGNAGKVVRIDSKGKVTELFTAPEPEVFAVWVDPDGTVFAGTSPRGKVYRIANGTGGKPDVFFDPGETYIWALARAKDGSLLVATGTQGKLFKVDAGGRGSVLYDSDDTHIRSMEVLPDGDVLLGTAGEGLILRLGKDGNARTLYDADEPEVVGLSVGPDGTCYAGVVSSESSLVDLSQPAAAGDDAQAAQGQPPADAGNTGDVAAGSRPAGASGPRSELLSISPAGVVESLWSFTADTVYDVLWSQGRLWAATGLEGKLYSWADRQLLLEKDVDERQIVALLPGPAGPAFATTNGSALYRVTAQTEKTGTYTSAVLDAGQASRFGTFRWRGETPGGTGGGGGGGVRFSFRSGMSAEPDRTWSPWTAAKRGEEITLEDLPRGRYVQWKAELQAGSGASPVLNTAELSYRQENLSPRIDGFAALEPGQILVPQNFNPSNQVYEPAHPTREGIFTTVGQPADEDDGRTKPLWKKGFRTLRWAASDPNQDSLEYELAFQPAESNVDWLRVADGLEDNYYAFDATALPDGVYRFRLRASDRPSNDPGSAQVAERISDPVVVDNTTPVLVKVDRQGGKVRATVRDSASPLREAMYSVDAQEWKPVPSADGLIDGQTETLVVDSESKPGGLLLLRVTDASYNVVTFNLSEAREAR